MLGPLLLVFSVLLYVATGQNCPIVTPDDLGNTTTPSTNGLLPTSLAVLFGTAPPSIQILQANVVCLAQGSIKYTYRTISLVVRYLRAADMMEAIVQVEYQCMGVQWQVLSTTLNPVATLMTTALRSDCSLCLGPLVSTAVPVDETHCAGKTVCA